eukprot:COSAG05_NODE_4649_length_1424_cov_1.150943_2_plen_193_part_00
MSCSDWWHGMAGRVPQESTGLSAWGLLADLAKVIFSLTIAASSAESNWSDHAVVISKARNRLSPSRSIKLVYLKVNQRAINTDFATVKLPNYVAKAQVDSFLKTNRTPHATFPHPTDAGDLCTWGVQTATIDDPDEVMEPIPGLDDDDVDDDPNDLLAPEKFDYEGDVSDCPDFANLEVSTQPLQLQYSTLC